MFRDTYDLEVSCSSDKALQAFLAGIDCALRFDQPGIKELRNAVTLDDEFALAHAALGRQLFIHGQKLQCGQHLDRALELKPQVTQRERNAIDVVERAARSDPEAAALAQQHVSDYPQDVFVLAHLLGPFGLLAFSGSDDWCSRNVELLKATRSYYRSDDWWHLTTRGFFGAEQGQLKQAREDCERAWAISENGNCAHSLAHMHFEAGALDEGRDFINQWVSDYGKKSDMRHHLVWHVSLLDLESGVDMHETYELYDRELDSKVNDPTPLETFCDNASFLWRCHLAGKELPANVREELLEYGEANFGFSGFAFADIHRAMTMALQFDDEKSNELIEQLRDVAAESGTRVAECVLQFALGFRAFANIAYEETVNLLEPVLVDTVLLGGSNPQRRIVEETYLEACLRSKNYSKARRVLRGRNRPGSVFDSRLLDEISQQTD